MKGKNTKHPTLFFKRKDKNIVLLLICIDDMTMDDKQDIVKSNKKLSQGFDLKDLRKLWYFIHIKMAKSDMGMVMNQWKYILDLLKRSRG